MVRKVTIYTRAAEYSNDFRVDDGLLLCIYCIHSVKWEKKSSIKDHIQGVTHCAKKENMKTNKKPMEMFYNRGQLPQQF